MTNIEWTPSGKVRKVTKSTGSPLEFRYDAAGNRVEKKQGTVITRYIRDASGNVMAVYQADTLSERPIYGSSRLGNLSYASKPGYRTVGHKQYELSNHLGNVLAVVSDRIRMKTDSTWTQVLSRTDYYPFGLEMTGRTESAGYRYGFNGKEMDPSGQWSNQSHYDYGFRIYNPTIGKFLSVDPLTKKYSELTPYNFGGNNPIFYVDPDGREIVPGFLIGNEWKTFLNTLNSLKINELFNKVYEQVHGSPEYFSVNRFVGTDINSLVNNSGEFNRANDGVFFNGGSYFNKHQINFNQKANAFGSHRTVFEEIFHAGQYLFDKEKGSKRSDVSDFILEVEVRVARAFVAGDDQAGFGNEKYVQEFSQNDAVKSYFSKIRSGVKLSEKETLNFRNEVKGLAIKTLNAGYGKYFGIDEDDIKDYKGETNYLDSIIK